jgi:hypothetical protein
MRLRSPDMLRELMKHTGDGGAVSIRDLATAAGCHHSLIGRVLVGSDETFPAEVAGGIARRIGADLLVLFEPDERTAAAVRGERPAEAVSA